MLTPEYEHLEMEELKMSHYSHASCFYHCILANVFFVLSSMFNSSNEV